MCMRERHLKSVWFHASTNPRYIENSIVDHMATNHALPIIFFFSNQVAFFMSFASNDAISNQNSTNFTSEKKWQFSFEIVDLCVCIYSRFDRMRNWSDSDRFERKRGKSCWESSFMWANFVLICTGQLIWMVPSAPTNQPTKPIDFAFFPQMKPSKKEKERKKCV